MCWMQQLIISKQVEKGEKADLKEKYPEVEQDWKSWCTVALKDTLLKYPLKFNNEKDIENYIDAFFMYHTKEYGKYLNNVAMYVNEYYRDYPFVLKFMKTQL